MKSIHGLPYVGGIFVSLCVRKFMNSYSDSKVSLNITKDDYVTKMSRNSKNSTKSTEAAPPNETKEDNMAKVSKLLLNIQKDLTEVKHDLKRQ